MRIETLTLLTSDLEAQRAFYEARLGFATTLDEGGTLVVAVGESSLCFRHEPGFQGRYHFALGVPRSKVAAAEAYLRVRGADPIPDAKGATRFDFDFWDAEATYFYDAGGNIGEFIGRSELGEDGDSRTFAPEAVLGISEAGLACADVDTVVEALAPELGVTGYREVGPTFHPLGDVQGLLILVPKGRAWFPDARVPAEALPCSITLATARGRFRLETAPLAIERL